MEVVTRTGWWHCSSGAPPWVFPAAVVETACGARLHGSRAAPVLRDVDHATHRGAVPAVRDFNQTAAMTGTQNKWIALVGDSSQPMLFDFAVGKIGSKWS